MKKNKVKFAVAILIWLIVAFFFYAAIWTNDKNSLSDCWLLTGLVAIGQIMCTLIFFQLLLIED